MHPWGTDTKPEDRSAAIDWKREEEKVISIKYGSDDSWEKIEYETSDFAGAYCLRHTKLVEKGTDKFWGSCCPLYKKKR